MKKEGFFLNYGGPGEQWYTSNQTEIPALDQACDATYGPPRRSVNLSVQGLKLKIMAYGVHRAIHVELPPFSSYKTHQLYDQLRETALDFCDKDYAILNNNFVTAVTTILHQIDPTIVPQYLVFPWSLDDTLKEYQHQQVSAGFLKQFFNLYEQKLNQQNYFSFISNRAKLREIKSLHDVLNKAYQGEHHDRERTKSALIELNWVTEDEQGLLHPSSRAPMDFRLGLIQFNQDYQAVTVLKNIVSSHEITQKTLNKLFQDSPDYTTAMERTKHHFMSISPTAYADIEFQMEIWQHAQEMREETYDLDDNTLNEEQDDDPSFKT
ncbi:MAG: hypothetical protein NTU48_09800 [Legionellales bacterium]|nr:hypothetical protein [Legionellales bacterium]